MSYRVRSTAAFVVIVGLAALTACGEGSRARVTGLLSSQPAPSERIASRREYMNGHIRLDPPAQSDTSSLDAAHARSAFLSSSPFGSSSSKATSTEVLFGRYSDDDYGSIGSGGSVTPRFVNQPAWIVILHGVPTFVRGPFTVDLKRNPPPPSDLIVVLDAATGKYLTAYQQSTAPDTQPN
jgi:hypothetical protein